jgi:hypothetical protein
MDQGFIRTRNDADPGNPWCFPVGEAISGYICLPPVAKVQAVQHQAKYVGRYKSQLRGSETNNADDDTIHGGQYPAFPAPFSYQDCRKNGQHTGNVIQTQHEAKHLPWI